MAQVEEMEELAMPHCLGGGGSRCLFVIAHYDLHTCDR